MGGWRNKYIRLSFCLVRACLLACLEGRGVLRRVERERKSICSSCVKLNGDKLCAAVDPCLAIFVLGAWNCILRELRKWKHVKICSRGIDSAKICELHNKRVSYSSYIFLNSEISRDSASGPGTLDQLLLPGLPS